MTTLRTNPRTVSICCHGEVLDAMAGNTRDGVTHYFVCSECNRATDAIQLPEGAKRLLRKKLAQAGCGGKVRGEQYYDKTIQKR